MKLLWLCNNAPGCVRSHLSGKPESGVNWMDHVLSGLRQQGFTVRVLYRGTGGSGAIDGQCSYASFGEGLPYVYQPELEAYFRQELRSFQPDVIHSWGVEYDHALAMTNAAREEGMLENMVASIQGLCFVIGEHYTDGLPEKVVNANTFRDFVRKDNIARQQEKFRLRGKLEQETLKTLRYVIGRTSWDYAHTKEVNPDITYHFCNETLREPFYSGQWRYENCKKYQIFASSCAYPVKGFHYLLEALAKVREVYPDATLTVTGHSCFGGGWKAMLRRGSYEGYLARIIHKYHLENAVEFLGDLSAEEMKQAFLNANVFVLPSTMENSPNSLGEAMILGLPAVAAEVGGVKDLLRSGSEGFAYAPGDVESLTADIIKILAMEQEAEELGNAARDHALVTHDPETNLKTLIEIYKSLS